MIEILDFAQVKETLQLCLLMAEAMLVLLPLTRLVDGSLHIFLQLHAVVENVVASEWVNWELVFVYLLVYVHLGTRSFAQINPLILLISVLYLHFLDVLLLLEVLGLQVSETGLE